MPERFSPQQREEDIKKAFNLEKKSGHLITNPMAWFNLGLDESNFDWQPKPGSGLEPAADPVPSEKLLRELESPEMVADPETGQKFNVLKLNWDAQQGESGEAHRTIVFLPPYNNAIEQGATRYRIQELARQIGWPVLAIDHPQMGKSDPLTEQQKKALGSDGYGSIAEAELRIMKQLGIKGIDVAGQSMGAWAAVSIAERAKKYGLKVKNAVIIESPGLTEMKPIELAMKERGEGKYIDLYQTSPYDPVMRYESGFQRSAIRKNIDMIKWVASTFKNDPGGVYVKSMARDSVLEHMRRALMTNDDLKLSIIHGSISQVSPHEANKALVQTLDKEFPGRVNRINFPGEPHAVMEHAKRFAALTKLILTGSAF